MLMDPIVIPAGKTVTLSQDRVYIMVMDLKKALLAGDSINLTLNFSDGSKTKLPFPVGVTGLKPAASPSASN